MSNETFGITVEYLLAQYFEIPCSIELTRVDRFVYNDRLKRLLKGVSSLFAKKGLVLTEHTGKENTYHDFRFSNGKSLSVKTNTNGYKVCPQNIGQISKRKWTDRFLLELDLSDTTIETDIKNLILYDTHRIINDYLENLFVCDYLLWFYFEKSILQARLINCKLMLKKLVLPRNISFTRTHDWNESTTVKMEDISIGEFQIHNHRNVVKFRFNLMNLLLLKK